MNELCEGAAEGFDVQRLGRIYPVFCGETVSFLDYMKAAGSAGGLAVFLDEPSGCGKKRRRWSWNSGRA